MKLLHVQKILHSWNIDALLIEEPTDLFYLTGLELSCGSLALTANLASLFVDGRYITYAADAAAIPVSRSAVETSFSPSARVGIDSRHTSMQRLYELQSKRPDITWVPIDQPLKWQRMIKDATELAAMQRSATICREVMQETISSLRDGLSEKQLADAIEQSMRQRGAEKSAFDSIVSFGKNSALPHHRAGSQALEKGDIVLIDIGASVDHWQSDMTRTVFWGQPDPKLQQIYSIVEEAQTMAMRAAKPGLLIAELDSLARDYIATAGFGSHFVHGLGHGIGLDVHEFPSLKNKEPFKDIPLRCGMVITIEPGIYIQGLGGVRIEDTLAITETGSTCLTRK